MKKLKYLLIILPLMVFLSACSSDSDNALTFSLKTGKSYTIQINKQIKNYKIFNGEVSDVNQNVKIGFSFTPKSISEDGTYLIEGKFLSIGVNQESVLGNISYDSEIDKDAPLIAKPFANLLNAPFIVKVKKDGSVISVEGMNANIEKAFDDFKINEESVVNNVKATVTEMFNDDALLETFERMLAFYPGKVVKPHEKWNKTVSFTNHLPFILESEFQLREQNNGVAVIDVNSKLRTDSKKMSQNRDKYPDQDLIGEQNGKLMIDQISGWLTKAEYSYKIHDINPSKLTNSKSLQPMLLSSETKVQFSPLVSTVFRDIVWSPNSIMKGDGIGMTVIGMGVVYVSLVLLYLMFLNVSKVLKQKDTSSNAHSSHTGKQAVKDEAPKKEVLTGEINAAIALALYFHNTEIHDEESSVLTIQRASRLYSPWSSKIYGLTKEPR